MNIIDCRNDARALIRFSDCSGNDTLVDIRYEAIKLKIIPEFNKFTFSFINDSLEFEYQVINDSESKTAVLDPGKNQYTEYSNIDLKFSKYFKIIEHPDYKLPFELMPGDTAKFFVRFLPDQGNNYWDSLGVGDTYSFWFKAKIEVAFFNPIITASDWDFVQVIIGTEVVHDFEVNNTGSTPLIITGYTGPFNDQVFRNNIDTKMTFPFNLEAGEKISYSVSFKPNTEEVFSDSIIFHSNADKIDSLAVFNREGKRDIGVKGNNGKSVSVTVSPNPASDFFIIKYSGTKPGKALIKLYNHPGGEIFNRKVLLSDGGGSFKINTISFPASVYLGEMVLSNGKNYKFSITVIK